LRDFVQFLELRTVGDRLSGRRPPAVGFPPADPIPHAVDEKLGVGAQLQFFDA
jgi:hypothetical protein